MEITRALRAKLKGLRWYQWISIFCCLVGVAWFIYLSIVAFPLFVAFGLGAVLSFVGALFVTWVDDIIWKRLLQREKKKDQRS